MQLYLVLAAPILLLTLWLYTAHIASAQFPRLVSKRICLLIAHPDDEAMFFAPTVLALTNPDLGNHVKILCLSSGESSSSGNERFQRVSRDRGLIGFCWNVGNADGLGETRKRELVESAMLLGLRSPADVFIIDDPEFPDSMTTTWPAEGIAGMLSSAFTPSSSTSKSTPSNSTTRKSTRSSTSSSSFSRNTPTSTSSRTTPSNNTNNEPPTSTIDILLTFDPRGISSHPNHISLHHGAIHYLRALMKNKQGWTCPVTLYTLSSTNILRKYISILDAPFTMLKAVLGSLRDVGEGGRRAGREMLPRRLVFLSDVGGYRRAQRAMTGAHRSQMRWFRWGWVGVGRFMVVNDLWREKI